MSITLIVVISVIVILALAIGVWSFLQSRGAKKFDERWDKMSEDEKRKFQQNSTSTKLG